MKFIKQWARNGHTVIIQAKFFKNGFFPSWAYSEDEIKDLVKIEAKIYNSSNPDDLKEISNFSTDAYEGKYNEVVEKRWLRKDITRDLTIVEAYEKSLNKITAWCNEDIDRRNYNKKI